MQRIKKAIKKRIKAIVKFIGYKWILPLVYQWYARKPIDEKLVVFADRWDRPMPDNFRGLYEMCKKNGFRCEVLSGESFLHVQQRWERRKEKVKFQYRFIKLFAQCRVLFLADYFPLSDIVTLRPETQVVQLWHGCGLMKKWGYAVTSTGWGTSDKEKKRYPIYVNHTLSTVSSASPVVKEGYRSAFRCDPSIIKPLGSPRTDIYFDKEFHQVAKEKVHSLFPQIGNRKIILYAPTYRGASIARSYINSELDYKGLKKALSDRYVLLTKFHPLMAGEGLTDSEQLEAVDFVFDVSKLLKPEEALCAADILIADYSSILFEFLLLERPIVSYIYDIEEYIQDRGLFLPYDQLAPGPYVSTQEELIEKLRTVDDWFDIQRTREYREEFMSACDGHSTERIYRYVFEQASFKP